MTYLQLATVFVAVTLPVLAVAVFVRRPDRRWWAATGLTALVLCVLTAVFDSIMIAADLFRFDESSLIGIHVGLAPIEDFAWPIAATVLVSALTLLLDRDEARA
ncbi:lycopene cyclase domain-containing protein [Aeromicrobium senzhongii]|uniref:Lycopene cyclase domain-containing protein n=1 Tax=Aeromicrobium senzhongii TaxID=2663859 RepID=A0ABX6SV15_9ACTN|nr:lycopene cyclase domain-containing protein [Aeromicrobium senzhongii]MTB89419.1 lycopene cyclase domain-containing protein [Aeromicrobium senzhongii]QNL94437.1 lycopene cyclase domain-containing protein [Aeromicrobium senzhongii]